MNFGNSTQVQKWYINRGLFEMEQRVESADCGGANIIKTSISITCVFGCKNKVAFIPWLQNKWQLHNAYLKWLMSSKINVNGETLARSCLIFSFASGKVLSGTNGYNLRTLSTNPTPKLTN